MNSLFPVASVTGLTIGTSINHTRWPNTVALADDNCSPLKLGTVLYTPSSGVDFLAKVPPEETKMPAEFAKKMSCSKVSTDAGYGVPISGSELLLVNVVVGLPMAGVLVCTPEM